LADGALAVINDYRANGQRSLGDTNRRIEKHLIPYFGAHRRLAGIDAGDVAAYVAYRQTQGVVKNGKRVRDVANAQVNRELAALKRIFNLAVEQGRLATLPKVKLLREANARSGFFEREQFDAVVARLPVEVRAVAEFGYITGWRVHSEVLPLEWRQVDFAAGEIRLDAGTTKNDEPRTFPMTVAVRRLLEARKAERDRLPKESRLACRRVFFRVIAGKPQPIVSFRKAWRNATCAAGCPGRIVHDLRRTAVRNLVRAGIPERVAMQMTGHKTRSIFDRYDIVSGGDLRAAAAALDATSVAAATY
jgi:integrase